TMSRSAGDGICDVLLNAEVIDVVGVVCWVIWMVDKKDVMMGSLDEA
ncbi:13771_t:CDS:1, partial [Acaulospora morrowiae]